jgi:MFS family permease
MLMVTMAAGTLVIAVTPGYATIGLAAPIIITAGRALQGLSAAGEFGSATAMRVEYASPRKIFFYGSFQMCSQSVGYLFAALAGYVLTTFVPHGALEEWV